MKGLPVILLSLIFLIGVVPEQALAQEPVQCEVDHVVQKGESLSTIAEDFLGNRFAYPVLVIQANAQLDDKYTNIYNPAFIESGDIICIPRQEDLPTLLETEIPKLESREIMENLTEALGISDDELTQAAFSAARSAENTFDFREPIDELPISVPALVTFLAFSEEASPDLAEALGISSEEFSTATSTALKKNYSDIVRFFGGTNEDENLFFEFDQLYRFSGSLEARSTISPTVSALNEAATDPSAITEDFLALAREKGVISAEYVEFHRRLCNIGSGTNISPSEFDPTQSPIHRFDGVTIPPGGLIQGGQLPFIPGVPFPNCSSLPPYSPPPTNPVPDGSDFFEWPNDALLGGRTQFTVAPGTISKAGSDPNCNPWLKVEFNKYNGFGSYSITVYTSASTPLPEAFRSYPEEFKWCGAFTKFEVQGDAQGITVSSSYDDIDWRWVRPN